MHRRGSTLKQIPIILLMVVLHHACHPSLAVPTPKAQEVASASMAEVFKNIGKLLAITTDKPHGNQKLAKQDEADDEPLQPLMASGTNGFGGVLAERLVGDILSPQSGDIRDFLAQIAQNFIRLAERLQNFFRGLTGGGTFPPPFPFQATSTPLSIQRFPLATSSPGEDNRQVPLYERERVPPASSQVIQGGHLPPSYSRPGAHGHYSGYIPKTPQSSPGGQLRLQPPKDISFREHQTSLNFKPQQNHHLSSSSSSLSSSSSSNQQQPQIQAQFQQNPQLLAQIEQNPQLLAMFQQNPQLMAIYLSHLNENLATTEPPGGVVGKVVRGVVTGAVVGLGLAPSTTPPPPKPAQEQYIYILPSTNDVNVGNTGGSVTVKANEEDYSDED